MWATKKHPGFTIVELLIVIVIIAILAVITIVAYNGITNRAHRATVQSDLHGAANTLEVYNVPNNSYPADLTAAGLSASSGTTYQYAVDNNAVPSTYCLTATNATISYYINSTTATTPKEGGCPGHGVGGVDAVTNVATNPSFETDLNGWGSYFTATRTRVSTEAKFGTYSQKVVTSNNTQAQGTYASLASGVYTPSSSIQASIWVKASAGLIMTIGYRSPVQLGSGYGAHTFTTTGSWQLATVTYTLPSLPDSYYAPVILTTSPFPAAGTTFYVDGLMSVVGGSASNYADGATASWIWNGTINDSTSTGPPQ